MTGQGTEIYSIVFSPDGARALSGGDGFLKLWDLYTGQVQQTFVGHVHSIVAVAFGRNGRVLSGSQHHSIRVWDGERGTCLGSITLGDGSTVTPAIAIAADGSRAVTGGPRGALVVWDPSRQERLRALVGHEHDVEAVVMSGDGRRAISAAADRALRVWDLDTGACLRSLPTAARVTALAMTPDACHAVSGHEDGSVVVWRLVWSLQFPGR
jgi:WD40 repeat protein